MVATKRYKTPKISVVLFCADTWTDTVSASDGKILAETDPYLLDLF